MQDVACPQCEYNLRGLHGPIVSCPECGHTCDIAQLISARWERPWYAAPKFHTVTSSVTWAVFLGPLFAGGSIPLLVSNNAPLAVLFVLPPIIMFGGWALFLYLAYRVFDSWRGVHMALLAHVVFVSYCATLALSIIFGFAVWKAMRGGSVWQPVFILPLLAIAFPAAWYGRRGERWIAEQCIREYLRRQSRGPVV